MDDANEVSNALSQGIDTGLDEGELEDEFAELMGEAAGVRTQFTPRLVLQSFFLLNLTSTRGNCT